MLEGITAGMILSITLFPATVWMVRVGYCGERRQVLVLGAAFWLSQMVWLVVAVPGLMIMTVHLHFLSAGMHWFAAFVLGYIGIKMFRTRRVERLDGLEALPPSRELFVSAFMRSLAMPMRLPAAMAVLLATGLFINHPPSWETVPGTLIGVLIGVSWWWGKVCFLVILFVRRVSERVTLKSLNKIRPFCGLLYCLLAVLALFFIQ